jgi:hypothetical protein
MTNNMIYNTFVTLAISYSMSRILFEINIIVIVLAMFLVLSLVEYGIYSYVYNKKYIITLWLRVLVTIVGAIPLLLAIYRYNARILSKTTFSIIVIVSFIFASAFMGILRASGRLKEETKKVNA